MKRGRKGILQIDWVISFALFFVYLAWFFIFIRPIAGPADSTNALLSNVKIHLLNDASWSVDKIPIFITSNLSLEEEPIIMRFSFLWGNHFGFSDSRDFMLSEGKIFFLANLTNQSPNVLWLAHSSENYSVLNITRDFIASPDSAVVNNKQFSATFKNSIPEKIIFRGKERVAQFNISFDTAPVKKNQILRSEFNNTNAVARYAAKGARFNNSLYLFAENSKIYGFAYADSERTHNFTLTLALNNYTQYYATDLSKGTIDYNNSCISFTSNYLDLYDQSNGITLMTQDVSNMTLCGTNATAVVSLIMTLKNETSYSLILHDGDYKNTTKLKGFKKQTFGIVERLTGLSISLLNNINQTSYASLKGNWSYPRERNFAFILTNSTDAQIAAYKPVSMPDNGNIFVIKTEEHVMDKHGVKKKHTLLIQGW